MQAHGSRVYGSAGLISNFVNLNLIDEFRIAIMPIILGKGNPLFKAMKNVVLLLIQINRQIFRWMTKTG